jgi:HK97 family phage prohead protease
VPEAIGTGDNKRPQEQAVAICYDYWRESKKSLKQCDPNDYDDEDEFMSDCMDEYGDEDRCQTMWDNKSAPAIKHRTHAGTVNGLEFVLSDESVDRMDDIIAADGWDLSNFKKNPIALFNHRSDWPIGRWKNLRVENKELRGHLELAPQGTSDRIDEIRKLIEAGILRAVSVGFRPIESKLRENGFGSLYTRSELVETSLVAVPANPNALAVAKGLKISPETIDMIFAGQGKKDRVENRGFEGGHAKRSVNRKGGQMSSLAQRISDLEVQINTKRDALTVHLEKMDDSNVSNTDLEMTGRLNADILQMEKTRDALVDSEKLLAKSAMDDGQGGSRALVINGTRQEQKKEKIAAPPVIVNRTRDSVDFLDLFIKAGTLAISHKAWGSDGKGGIEATRMQIAERYPEYREESLKIMSDLVLKSATAPAMTTVTGWALELAQITWAALMPLLIPQAILTRLAPRGLTLSFDRAGQIRIPTRNRTPTLAGSFVGEGLAIPVRQGMFTSQSLTPKKMAVITTWTREMDQHSIPAIEGLLREAIQQDTQVAIDTVLIDANPATAVRPAGLLNGVSATTATAGGGMAAFIGDLVALIGAISAGTYGNIRTPVWLVNQVDMLRASLLQATNTGIFPFRDEIGRGTLNGIPLIDSATVPSKTMILVDAADFVVVGEAAPRMELSDQATLHMEDTSPQDLVISPSTVAAPQKSLFQTDSIALRMVLPLNWVQRRAGTVAWVQNVTW